MSKVVAFLIATPFTFALLTWVMMLAFGMWHSVIPAVPALGFWQSAIVTLGVTLVNAPRAIFKGFVEDK